MVVPAFESVAADDVAGFSGLIDDIYAQRAVGVTITGAFLGDDLAQVLGRIDAVRRDAPRTLPLPASGIQILGCMLAPTYGAPSGPDFENYLALAREFRVGRLFDDPRRWRERLSELLEPLAGRRPLMIPKFTDGRSYADGTVRIVGEDHDVPLHCDTYRPGACWEHVDAISAPETRLSWYLQLAAPDAGGELIVYLTPRTLLPSIQAASEAPHLTLRVDPGDLVVFDAGRHYHAVRTCLGPRPRITMGGFGALARDRTALYIWG